MTDMPETAWLAPQQFGRPGVRIGAWSEWKAYDTTEYVRSDIHQALQAEKEALREALKECEAEIDGYIHLEYSGDHPLTVRRRKRDLDANPARAALAAIDEN